ncbi:hypothetical protein ACPWT1_21020 [Ramlibacter sp. MMS24-I3-19]|uniref:hypothetical protein n=1 Tax=Ramlibacter sp. MMS24-I3-19 TaxID=3416606 RepID=UPI003D06EBEA
MTWSKTTPSGLAANARELHTSACVPRVSYHGMRVLLCRRALMDFLRRWTFGIVLVLAVFGAQGSAVAAASSAPLLWALSQGTGALWVLAIYTAVGMLVLVAAEPVLWSRSLSDAERLIPVDAATMLRSDVVLGLMALLPLLGLLASGSWILVDANPPWLTCTPAATVAGVILPAVCAAFAWALTVAWRRRRQARARTGARSRRAHDRAGHARPVGVLAATVWLPLLRGVAPCFRAGLLAHAGCMLLATAAIALSPERAGWCLSIAAVCSLSIVRWTAQAATLELQPLLQDARLLPIALESMRAHLRCTVVACAALSMGPLAVAVSTLVPHREVPWLLYLSASLAAWFLHVTMRPRDPANLGALWLLSAAVLVALASEVPR